MDVKLIRQNLTTGLTKQKDRTRRGSAVLCLLYSALDLSVKRMLIPHQIIDDKVRQRAKND